MGCATGLAAQVQLNPKIHGWILYKNDLLLKMSVLKPSGIISSDKLSKIVKAYQCNEVKDGERTEKISLSNTDRERWLALILCFNMDLYDDMWPR